MTYWNKSGTHEKLGKQLQRMIPVSGAVINPRKNPKLEKFRKAQNCYHDLYNNGFGNRLTECREVFGFAASPFKQPWRGYGYFDNILYSKVELSLDGIILAAAKEQNLL